MGEEWPEDLEFGKEGTIGMISVSFSLSIVTYQASNVGGSHDRGSKMQRMASKCIQIRPMSQRLRPANPQCQDGSELSPFDGTSARLADGAGNAAGAAGGVVCGGVLGVPKLFLRRRYF